jgi:hypothetical protein
MNRILIAICGIACMLTGAYTNGDAPTTRTAAAANGCYPAGAANETHRRIGRSTIDQNRPGSVRDMVSARPLYFRGVAPAAADKLGFPVPLADGGIAGSGNGLQSLGQC